MKDSTPKTLTISKLCSPCNGEKGKKCLLCKGTGLIHTEILFEGGQ